MNTRKELGWWLEFAQKDLSKAKKKTVAKFMVDLVYKLLSYRNPFIKRSSKQTIASLFKATPGVGELTLLDDNTHKKLLGFQNRAKLMTSKIAEWVRSERQSKPDSEPLARLATITVSFELIAFEDPNGVIYAFNDLDTDKLDFNESAFFMGMFLNELTREDFGFCEYCGNLFLKVSQKNKRYCTIYCTDRASKQRGK